MDDSMEKGEVDLGDGQFKIGQNCCQNTSHVLSDQPFRQNTNIIQKIGLDHE